MSDTSAPIPPAGSGRPLLLIEGEPGDEEQIRTLRDDPGVVVVDRVEHQRAGLLRLRPPRPALAEEPVRWVYYPWRRTLVSILGPEGFRTLRLDRNRNKITRAEQERCFQASIGVVGLSVGHVIAHTLALEGLCGELRLADFDEIELSNLNRIPATLLDLGENKALVAARRIAEMDPYLDIVVVPDGLGPGNIDDFFDGLDIVIEECDSLDMKLVVREAARSRGIPVIMETSDRGLLDVERFDLEPSRPFFHGLLGEAKASDLAGLTTRDKVPYVMAILEPAQLSARMAASMAEIDYTVSTWPQLGGDVTLGAATVAATVRRLLRGDQVTSGRARIDLDTVVEGLSDPPPASTAPTGAAEFTPLPATDAREAVAQAAGLAPSGGNVQPWEFRLSGNRFSIHLVPERTSLMDVRYRGSYVAIGAAFHNARVAAASHRLLGPARICNEEDSTELAAIDLTPGSDYALAQQYPAVFSRCSNRLPAVRQPTAPLIVNALTEAAAAERARLRFLTDPSQVQTVANLLGESDRIRYLSPDLHTEMMSELRWPRADRLDMGLDVRTLALDPADLAKLSVARRGDVMAQLAEWDGGEALGENTRERVGSASAVLVLTVRGQAPADFVRGGAALQRCWLAAEQHEVGLQPVSPVFLYALDDADIAGQVPPRFRRPLADLRDRFRGVVGVEPSETLVMVLRLVHAARPDARSQRLALADVLRNPGSQDVCGLS